MKDAGGYWENAKRGRGADSAGRRPHRCRRSRDKRGDRALLESLEPRLLLAASVINWNDLRQIIDGFGASSAWMWNTIPSGALTQLFSPVNGAGLSLLRSRVTPSGGSTENLAMQQAGALGVLSWSTPWTPPREWKTNHDNNNGGSLSPAHYQDYADHLANYVEDLARQGIPLYALSIQNEPNWTASYESCRWTAQQFADFLPFLGETFTARGISAKIMLPEQLNWDFSLASIIMNNASLSQYVGILSAHNYGEGVGTYKPYTLAGGRSVWETEISTFVGGSEINMALDVANDIHQALTEANANAYHYWWLNAGDEAGLMTNWNATKRLWAMGQYSRFVRPGWVRIGHTDDGGLDITAFKDPASGKFAIVVVNHSTTSAVSETFTLNGVTASSVTPYVTSGTDNLTPHAAINLTGGTSFISTIGAQSIVTFYGISSTAPALQAPGNLRAAPVHGNLASQIALSWSDNSQGETAYTVERSTNGTNWTIVTTTLTADSIAYTDTGRAEHTVYYYRVKPTNGNATTYSAIASTSTIMRNPSGVNGTRVSGGINLSWTINSAVSTGVSIDRSLDGVTWTNIANLATRATSYSDVIPGYNSGQIYFYRIRNTAGGAYSAYTAWNTGLTTPASFAVAGTTISSVTLTWSGSLGASGAWIERRNPNGSWTVVSPSSLRAADGAFTITGLSGGTTYTFRMRTSAAADSLHSAYSYSLNATTAMPSANPVVWYRADESAGTTLGDSSGNAKNATLTGSYSFVSGVTGNAVNLTGGYATAPGGIVSTLGDFTIATWVRPTSLDNWARILDFGTGTSNFMCLTLSASETSRPRFSITTGSGQQQINSSIAVSANTWTHVAITLSGSTATLYINGSVAGTNTSMTLTPASLGATTQNYIGRSQYSWDPMFRGAVDDFRIYERALSVQEVAALAKTVPTVAVPAAASPAVVTANTSVLTVLGADRAGEASLTYTWAATGNPPAPVNFSANGTNAAKYTVATFSKAGTYNLAVTIASALGLTVQSSVTVTVTQTLTGATISPAVTTLMPGGSTQLGVYGSDQFGDAMATELDDIAWAVYSGVGSISSSGLFTAPVGASGTTTVRAITAGGDVLYTNITLLNQAVWYPANTVSGATLTDASGNGRDATLTGAAAFGPGIEGNALALTGGYASLPTGIVSGLNDFTIAAWVKIDTLSNWSRIFDFGTGESVNMFLTPRNSISNVVRFAITTSGAGGEQQINGLSALATGSWQHVAVTLAGTTGILYVNGMVVGVNASMTLRPSSLGATTQNYLGDSQYAADPAFLGSIDDFRIVGRALSATEIQRLVHPVVVHAAASDANPVNAATTVLRVLGADVLGGEAGLTYTWSAIGTPPAPVTFSVNGSNAARNTIAGFTRPGAYSLQVTIRNPAGYAVSSTVHLTVVTTVAGRWLFYRGSSFDTSLDHAIAPDKSALLPGQTATFVNYSSYVNGINGILIDIAGPVGALSEGDFVFKVGNSDEPSDWPVAPAPTGLIVHPGAGIGGSTRVELTWAHGAIVGKWLEVTLKGGDVAASNLAADDVFHFGNAVGDSGDETAHARVTSADEIAARAKGAVGVAITDRCDYNRDGNVDGLDQLIARGHATSVFTALRLITAPVPLGLPAAGGSASPLLEMAVESVLLSACAASPPGVIWPLSPVNMELDLEEMPAPDVADLPRPAFVGLWDFPFVGMQAILRAEEAQVHSSGASRAVLARVTCARAANGARFELPAQRQIMPGVPGRMALNRAGRGIDEPLAAAWVKLVDAGQS